MVASLANSRSSSRPAPSFFQHEVAGLHAPSRVLGDPHWKCSSLPVGRGECRGAEAHALSEVTVLDVEVAKIEAPSDPEDDVLQLMPLHGGSGGPRGAEDALARRRVHQCCERRFLAQIVGPRGSLRECAQQSGQRAVKQCGPAIVVDAAVGVPPA